MKLLKQDILKRVKKIAHFDDISKMLLQLGHENNLEDSLVDLELTPNRGDCFSLLGILRDLHSLTETNLEFPIYDGEIEELELSFENSVPEFCPKITFAVIEIDNDIKNYRDYLENFFSFQEKSKINFFTDISNYLSYEIGQPTHCYDFDKLNTSIKLERITNKSKFESLIGQNISLHGENYVFTSNNEIINLAGVMGGKSTSCSKDTNKILLECAYFEPEKIIGTNLKYDLNSEAAHKFERGVDPQAHDFALRRFLRIVSDHVQISSVKSKTFVSKKIRSKKIDYDLNQINQILGTNISDKFFKDKLTKIGFDFCDSSIIVPSHRHDVERINDLSEEIARIIGYDSIVNKKISLPKIIQKQNLYIKKLKQFLIDLGFFEVINFPFVEQENNNSIKIDNSLDSNKSFLRTDLKSSLINNLAFNERRQHDSIKFFEVSNIYHNKSENNCYKIGIIVSGRLGHNFNDFSKKIDKNYLKGIVAVLNPTKKIEILEIQRDLVDSKSKYPIFYTEFELNEGSEKIQNYEILKKLDYDQFVKYSEISGYPSTTRDLSFAISTKRAYEKILELLSEYESPIFKQGFVFDFYENNNDNTIKVGYRFVIQSKDKTLNESEINEFMDDIIKKCLDIGDVEIPGLKL